MEVKKTMNEIWLEKYRPATLNEVLGNYEIVQQFKHIVKSRSIPNMILAGPPGCGKTSSVLCIAKEIFGDKFNQAVIELNASDERGIDVIRTKVKEFAERKVKLDQGLQKLIILDEADSLTSSAQQALRMIISDYSSTTRFVFSCNNSSKIIEALQSRCNILRFSKLNEKDITKRLLDIIKGEKVTYDNGGIEALIYTSEGDMRTAVNNLQATAIGAGKVTKKSVFEICDIPNIEIIDSIVVACKKGERSLALMSSKQLWDENFTAFEIVNHIGKVAEAKDWNVEFLMEFIDEIGMAKLRISEGVSSFLQIAALTQRLCGISERSNNRRG